MWFIFVLPVALVAATASLLGMVNGGSIVVITVIADQWQRRRGYKPGEGVCTDREGGHLFGLKVAKDAKEDVGQFLAGMAEAFPDMFGRFSNHSFDLTVSEGEFLRQLVNSAKLQLDEYMAVVVALSEDPENDEVLELLAGREQSLRTALEPVKTFLQDVPRPRVKEAL